MLDQAPRVVFVPNRLDLFTAPFLAQDLDIKIQTDALVILDFSQTQSIDPAVTDVLAEAFIKAKQRRGRLFLKGVNPQVKFVLEIAGILKHFRSKSTSVKSKPKSHLAPYQMKIDR